MAKAKAKYEQSLQNKNHEITMEIERIKKDMVDQMCEECEATSRANEHQLQTIMS